MINSGREWDWMVVMATEDEGSETIVHLSNRTKVTYDSYINGNMELIFGWLKWGLCINFK